MARDFTKAAPAQIRKDERDFRVLLQIEQKIADTRDDVMSAVKNSGLSYREIWARCGPTPATLRKWEYKETKRPQLGTMVATLHAIGKTIIIGDI